MAQASPDYVGQLLRIDDDCNLLYWDPDLPGLAYRLDQGDERGPIGGVADLARFLDRAGLPVEVVQAIGDHWTLLPTWGPEPVGAVHPRDAGAEVVSWDGSAILWHR